MNKQNSWRYFLTKEIDPAFYYRAKFIGAQVEKARPARILDAGCGRGFYIRLLSRFSFIKEIHGLEIQEDYYKVAKQAEDTRIKVAKGSIYSTPYPDDYFDMVICSEVLEHLDDEHKALRELKKIIKPNGLILLTVPSISYPPLWDPLNWVLTRLFNRHVNKNIWWLAGIWADHERLYSRTQLLDLLMDHKFTVVHTTNVLFHCWPFTHFLLYGIGKNLLSLAKMNSFNRFSEQAPTSTERFLNWLMRLPHESLAKRDTHYVNICVLVQV